MATHLFSAPATPDQWAEGYLFDLLFLSSQSEAFFKCQHCELRRLQKRRLHFRATAWGDYACCHSDHITLTGLQLSSRQLGDCGGSWFSSCFFFAPCTRKALQAPGIWPGAPRHRVGAGWLQKRTRWNGWWRALRVSCEARTGPSPSWTLWSRNVKVKSRARVVYPFSPLSHHQLAERWLPQTTSHLPDLHSCQLGLELVFRMYCYHCAHLFLHGWKRESRYLTPWAQGHIRKTLDFNPVGGLCWASHPLLHLSALGKCTVWVGFFNFPIDLGGETLVVSWVPSDSNNWLKSGSGVGVVCDYSRRPRADDPSGLQPPFWTLWLSAVPKMGAVVVYLVKKMRYINVT